jgi:hypothetical protein
LLNAGDQQRLFANRFQLACADVPGMILFGLIRNREFVVRWSEAGLMVPTSILEAATLKQSIMPVCQCGHAARFEPHGLWWHFERRGWNDKLVAARLHFWCRVCGSQHHGKVRPARLDLVDWAAGDFELPWPDERVWKRAVSRLR